MQRETNYEKPILKFTPLQNKEDIAETCWGNHGNGYKYYDTAGSGYVAFGIADGSCTAAGGALQMLYYESITDAEPEQIYEGDPRYTETYNKIMAASGGSYGQPFKGEENFPDSPSGMS